jgi:hypothetical protein
MKYLSCRLRGPFTALVLVLRFSVGYPTPATAAPDGELRLEVVDSETRQAVPVRVELLNSRGRPVRLKNVGTAALGEHFYLPGTATLGLRRGDYVFNMDAGAEYRTQRGDFKIDRYADDAKTVEMRRFANLANEGWFAGDLDLQRHARDLPIVAAAEGVHYAPTIAWTFDGSKWTESHAMVVKPVDTDDPHAAGRELGPTAALVELAGGSLMLFADEQMKKPPLELEEGVTSLAVIRAAKEAGLHVVAATPTAWELPLWVASGELDGICVLTRQSESAAVVDRDPNGRPRDKSFFPAKRDLVRWGESIYFHVLNCGIEVTPLAGSGSGANESPLGTNRTYAYLSNSFTPEAWWQAVDHGAVVITNGPLVRPSVSGDPPGTTFAIESGETIDFQIALNMASRDTVEYLEILKNGTVEQEIRLSDWAAKGGKLPPVTFESSGWFAIRAATGNTDRRQFALTAPYYVESSDGPRVSRESVDFFLTWLDELEACKPTQRSCTDDEIASTRQYFEKLRERATAD